MAGSDKNSSPFSHEHKGIIYIPENMLLEIFQWLPVKDLCTIGRVCRKWRRVIADNSLWRHVDLRPYKLNLHKMWKVIRSHFSTVLLSLHLRGYASPASANWKRHSLSDAMLKELHERCPNIRELELVWTSLEGISVTGIPSKLQKLTVTDSLVPVGWFREIQTCPCKDTLVHLDLSRSTKTGNADLLDIGHLHGLTTLNLNFCYRVTEVGLKSIADNHNNLLVLEIAETRCTDLALHHISRGVPRLTTLNISGCGDVTDAGLGSVGACLKALENLQAIRCQKITDVGLEHLKNLKSMRVCDVSRTNVTQEGIDRLKKVLKNCELIGPDIVNDVE